MLKIRLFPFDAIGWCDIHVLFVYIHVFIDFPLNQPHTHWTSECLNFLFFVLILFFLNWKKKNEQSNTHFLLEYNEIKLFSPSFYVSLSDSCWWWWMDTPLISIDRVDLILGRVQSVVLVNLRFVLRTLQLLFCVTPILLLLEKTLIFHGETPYLSHHHTWATSHHEQIFINRWPSMVNPHRQRITITSMRKSDWIHLTLRINKQWLVCQFKIGGRTKGQCVEVLIGRLHRSLWKCRVTFEAHLIVKYVG